jgi:hypothetical protein
MDRRDGVAVIAEGVARHRPADLEQIEEIERDARPRRSPR